MALDGECYENSQGVLALDGECYENGQGVQFQQGSGVEIAQPTSDLETCEYEQLPLKTRVHKNFLLAVSSGAAGFGMFGEAYFLFALGNVKAIWTPMYPNCFSSDKNSSFDECNDVLVSSLSYGETASVMIGMLTFGFIASAIGRRKGSIITALFMFIGALVQTVSYGSTPTMQFSVFLFALILFSYGVGGEYPLASASAAERAHKNIQKARKAAKFKIKQIRGKTVVLTFAMQGWGNWVNTMLFVLVTAAYNCNTDNSYGSNTCFDEYNATWRIVYAIGTVLIFLLLVGRLKYTEESKLWKEQKSKKEKVTGEDQLKFSQKLRLLNKNYWHRMVGTAGGWFVWDVVFYGNKLFQAQIINNIVGENSVTILLNLEYVLLNSSIALVGYYVAAFTVDQKWMGRKRMQSMGFFMTFLLFLICGLCYDTLSKPEYSSLFQFLYYTSSFFGQWGPNATTWLLPSELYPTEVRTEAHGFSAACGKAGALTATLIFTFGNNGNPLDAQSIFIVCSLCGIIGLVLTLIFVPDVTSLDLQENDMWWEQIQKGDGRNYTGPARSPEFLSWYERCIGVGTDSNIQHTNSLEVKTKSLEKA